MTAAALISLPREHNQLCTRSTFNHPLTGKRCSAESGRGTCTALLLSVSISKAAMVQPHKYKMRAKYLHCRKNGSAISTSMSVAGMIASGVLFAGESDATRFQSLSYCLIQGSVCECTKVVIGFILCCIAGQKRPLQNFHQWMIQKWKDHPSCLLCRGQ